MNRGMLAALLLMGWLAVPVSGQQTQLGSFSQNRQATYDVQPYDGQVLTTPGPSVWEGPPCPPANSLFGLGAGQTCFDSYTGWIGGVGVYYIKPAWDNNQAYIQSQTVANVTTTTRTEFDYGYDFAPQAWIGYVGTSGFGVRGRWWMFDHSADAISFADPADGTVFLAQAPLLDLPTVLSGSPGSLLPITLGGIAGTQYTFLSDLNLYAIDLEGVQVLEHEQWSWVFSGGVRYASISQNYNVFVNNGAAFENMVTGHNFRGVGPTVSIEGRRQIAMSGFALYANARASILGGDGRQSVQVSRSLGPGQIVNASSENWEMLSIGELEVGTEWSNWLGVAKFFVRGGFVGQVWYSAGNASNTGLDGLPDDNTNLGFYGFRLALGVDY